MIQKNVQAFVQETTKSKSKKKKEKGKTNRKIKENRKQINFEKCYVHGSLRKVYRLILTCQIFIRLRGREGPNPGDIQWGGEN